MSAIPRLDAFIDSDDSDESPERQSRRTRGTYTQVPHSRQRPLSNDLEDVRRTPSLAEEGANLNELNAPSPINGRTRRTSLESGQRRASSSLGYARNASWRQAHLTELAAPPPIDRRRYHQPIIDPASTSPPNEKPKAKTKPLDQDKHLRSRLATEIYTLGYLTFFSILGTLARLGLEALTVYPNVLVTTNVLWANFGGSFFMGFLSEDQRIFREEWGGYKGDTSFSDLPRNDGAAQAAAKKKHRGIKKTIPLYIGLATGFCGSFTSFSSFIRDAFLELSNTPLQPTLPATHRSGGYSFLALLAVLLTEIPISIAALQFGAHVALALDHFTPTLPFLLIRRFIDPLTLFLSLALWLAAILLTIFPPHNHWRAQVLFPCVFAPIGCLTRFYASKYLNGRIPAFPLGTFGVNVFGTMILGMSYDLQRSRGLAGLTGCQVLQGVMEGFCGCLTTVSTWVAELHGLRRGHAYAYGASSVVVALASLVIIMGGIRWSHGFDPPACSL